MEKDERTAPMAGEGSTRLNIDALMSKFQQNIGDRWTEYRDTLSQFLMGKLSKVELSAIVSRLLGKEVHFHNYLLLSILANAFRELPPGEDTALNGWKQKITNQHTDTPIELLHREIMSLAPRERKRIRNITKDTGRKIPNPPPTVVATRQAMLPKIPYVQDKKAGEPKSKPRKQSSPSQMPDTMHPPRLSGPLMWTQDVIHGFDTPLSSESYEVPDNQNIGSRMLGISLENGLLRGIEAGTTDIMLASLNAYLDSVVSSLAEFTRNTTNKREPLTASDLNAFFDARSVELQEVLPPMYRLKTEFLRDEESVEEDEEGEHSGPHVKTEPQDVADSRNTRQSLLNLVKETGRQKRTAEQAALMDNAEQGKQFIRGLLG